MSKFLYITDQDEYTDHSFIGPLFQKYLNKHFEINTVFFSKFKNDISDGMTNLANLISDYKTIEYDISQKYLHTKYNYIEGSSANGLDFPELMVDMKVTSIKQPQSSCPFKSGMQKIFGLGYSILVFVYDKTDDHLDKTGTLDIKHAIFIEAARTADFQMTTRLHQIIKNNGNKDDIIAFFYDRFLPIDDITANQIAENLLRAGNINIGYLTISNALQWRLQYQRVINEAGNIPGINRVF